MTQSILVVEDDADLRALVVMMLSPLGLDIKTAANGAEALTSIRGSHPDLVLLDMKMPVMDGWRFAEALRETDAAPPPIVVMTAAESPAQRATEIGADGWLAKPFDVEDLLRCVRRHMPAEDSTPRDVSALPRGSGSRCP